MGFKKHNWIPYHSSSAIIIEIKLLEGGNYGRKLDFFRCDNNEDLKRILKLLKEKYNLG